ncbi:MAG: hypothetical protein A2504_07850 [Bdellovibrionales bacterium RIFOXYD12_FULL_39_22]|nr:MAG: hypothetical protein A2385_11175 [Bdellovibrionales bacterium RIFOXYB1_FULL_39_21]OFZ41257.1 MAG: hypothetical protein A2485_00510 [Bdellovibrionales bacterium RIFOXYC12_FULL_39_17]OFZ45093.1 MAG: hypothetical protein A2404_11470 [Bdellovibrionales bacterium RIFOXYC1_FULL_39_130]OFZ74477.1 MAG: hypothetical protein A2560_11505 [Bdellovibrionales bacterium RIFOXYD1_FULL_39_84]OFZ92489.1 MAG: hypothetical protein A2504_07850 [Bdellovibrionales bacterium RIFOXYD12_FULL_39_22]
MTSVFILLVACSSNPTTTTSNTDITNPNRDIAAERLDGRRDRTRFEIGEYTSRLIVNNGSGLIDVFEEFSKFGGLYGKNLKGIIIEARARYINSVGGERLPKKPNPQRLPMYEHDTPSEIILQGNMRRPIERFYLFNTYGERVFFYSDINREIGDQLERLYIQYDPIRVIVSQITLLTNDDRPWDIPHPLPPINIKTYGAIYEDGYSSLKYFDKANNEIDADFKANEKCQKNGHPTYCKLYKKEEMLPGEVNFTCSITDGYDWLTYSANSPFRLESEALTIQSCQRAGHPNYCNQELACSDGRRPPPNTATGCIIKDDYDNRTYFGQGINEVEAKFSAKRTCQSGGHPSYCKNARCETATERWQNNYVCTITDGYDSRIYRGEGKTKIEAEALARMNCDRYGHPSYCNNNLRCSN